MGGGDEEEIGRENGRANTHVAVQHPPNRARCVTRDTRVSRICPPIAKTRDPRARAYRISLCI